MIRHEGDGLWIEHDETVAAHHEEVFSLLTTPGGLTRWLPVAAKVDLRQGGLIVLGWDESFRSTTTIAILDYDPGGSITWDWHASRHDMHAPVYWKVEPVVEKGSRVLIRQGPFQDNTDSLTAMAEEAWFWCWHLCNLRTTLEAKHDMRSVRPL